jgi:hypothetical protein
LITIGSPRVGDPDFAASLSGIDYLRIVDCCDVVTTVPPETFLHVYAHGGTLEYVTREGIAVGSAEPAFVDQDREQARDAYPQLAPPKVLARALADHAPINYVRAFFP